MKIETTQEKVDQGVQELKDAGGSVTSNSVSFKGVEANYSFEDGILTVRITDKPWLASMEYVEGEIKKYFID